MKKIKVWYIPQVPMKSFEVDVNDIDEAIKIYETLIKFSIFEFENNVKPDYSDVGGVHYYDEENKEWRDIDELDGYEDWENEKLNFNML